MAMSVGMMGLTPARGASSAASVVPGAGTSRASKGRRIGCGGVNVRCAAVGAGRLTEQYLTLRIQPGASEKEVKKAFRLLALQYHPDVCKGSNCSVRFDQINEAYDTVISNLKEEQEQCQEWSDEETSWGELWEEWMGWEGAGIRDYSSHINPYI